MSEMTPRERFHAVMKFEPGARTLRWEFGYWVAVMERWYNEGLMRTPLSPPLGFPEGAGVIGEALPWPFPMTNLRYRDFDVNRHCGLEPGVVRIPLNWRMSPMFPLTVLEEDETTKLIINEDGAKMRVKKESSSLPHVLDGPVKDLESWEQLKEERFNTDNIMKRFPPRWEEQASTFQNRDYPFCVLTDGFFSLSRELFSIEKQLTRYYTEPELMHDICQRQLDVYLAIFEELFSKVDLDYVVMWEDMAFNVGPLVSPEIFDDFMVPYYTKITEYLTAKGVVSITVDTDGNCWKLIDGFLRAGVTGIYPFEVNADMDVVEVRKQFPTLQIQGGMDKMEVAKGKKECDAELEKKLPFMLKKGGFIPYMDHLVPPEVSWEMFCYYRDRVNDYIDQYCTE